MADTMTAEDFGGEPFGSRQIRLVILPGRMALVAAYGHRDLRDFAWAVNDLQITFGTDSFPRMQQVLPGIVSHGKAVIEPAPSGEDDELVIRVSGNDLSIHKRADAFPVTYTYLHTEAEFPTVAEQRLWDGITTDTPRDLVLDEVSAERVRQDEKWGEQNHADGTGEDLDFLGWTAPKIRNLTQNRVDAHAAAGVSIWSGILLEEVFEALSEDDPAKVRKELVQVAAVAVQWIEAIDRREVRDA